MLVTYKIRVYPTTSQEKRIKEINDSYWQLIDYLKNKCELNINNYGYPLSLGLMFQMIERNRNDELSNIRNLGELSTLKSAVILINKKYKENKNIILNNKYKYNKTNFKIINFQNNTISINDKYISIPDIGELKIRNKIKIDLNHELNSIQLKNDPFNRYYCLVTYDIPSINFSKLDSSKSIGLDFSMKHFYVDSNGEYPDFPFDELKLLERKRHDLNEKLKIKENGSNNYHKLRDKKYKINEKIRNIRYYNLILIAKKLVLNYDYIFVENLDINSMVTSSIDKYHHHYGTRIYELGYDKFLKILKHKADMSGKVFLKVDKTYKSSQTCHYCGYINKNTKDISNRIIKCPICHNEYDRDINAAINIKNRGLALSLLMINKREKSK